MLPRFEDWLVGGSLITEALMLATVGWVCWKNADHQPITTRWLIAAVGFRLIRFVMECRLSFHVVELSDPFVDDHTPDFSDGETIRTLAWELLIAACNIASWSCIAWAVLRRADDHH